MNGFDMHYFERYRYVVGMDEAGRGPIAGPVFSAAVFVSNLDEMRFVCEVGADSKSLNEKERERRYRLITENLIFVSSYVSAEDIDLYNIFKATQMSMLSNYEKLFSIGREGYVIVDGKNFKFPFRNECIIKGDQKSSIIGAASIIAKYERDAYMIKLSGKYPQYSFERHKGYPTKIHEQMIKKHGIFNEFRITFDPVRTLIVSGQIIADRSEFSAQRLLRIGM